MRNKKLKENDVLIGEEQGNFTIEKQTKEDRFSINYLVGKEGNQFEIQLIKIEHLFPDQRKKYLTKIRKKIDELSQHNHQNIIKYYGFFYAQISSKKSESIPCILREYVKAETLKKCVSKKNLSNQKVFEYLKQILEAVKYICLKNISSLYINSSDILITPTEKVILTYS